MWMQHNDDSASAHLLLPPSPPPPAPFSCISASSSFVVLFLHGVLDMASRDAISKVRVGRTTEYRMGTDTELLVIGGGSTELILVCGGVGSGDVVRGFRAGGLSLHMIRVRGTPVCLVSCTVGDHQWMLAKDSPVLRVEAGKYVFAMPGFCYGVALPSSGADDECRTMEEILMRFCCYRDVAQIEGSGQLNRLLNSSDDLWVHAYNEMKKLTTITAAAVINTNSTWSAAGNAFSLESACRKEIQRAVRTSAVVKLLSRSLLAGVLNPLKHLNLAAGNSLPSVQVVTDLLDAIETGRQPAAMHGWTNGDLWSINGEGIRLLIIILSACTGAGEKRKRPRLETLREEPEDSNGGNGGHASDGGGGGGSSSGATTYLSGGARLEKEMNVY